MATETSYWIEMMGRLRPGVSMAQAQAALAPRFHQWVATTAKTDGERAKLPALILNPGAAGLGSLRRQYSKPLYVLLAMVGLILAIACATSPICCWQGPPRDAAKWLSGSALGAGRLRVVRQLLTESVDAGNRFGGSIRGLVCDLGHAIADVSALPRAGELYAARGIETGTWLGVDGGASL